MLPGTPRTFIGSTTFAVRGLTAGTSERDLAGGVAAVDGVESVSVDVLTGIVTVRAGALVDRADITAAITKAGFTLVP